MKNKQGKILFSIDLEEFDIPEKYGQPIPLQTQLGVSLRGMQALQQLMCRQEITCTIFSTAFWAQHYPGYIRELAAQHEIASHTFHHSKFETGDLLRSRQVLSAITGKEIKGLRMPQMQAIDNASVTAAGYTYNASLHPTWLPGRYNHLSAKPTLHTEKDLWILPASVTPLLRIPIFWLVLKNAPVKLYQNLCRKILNANGYLVLYMHPWEFTDLRPYTLPALVKRKDGAQLLSRLEQLFHFFKEEGHSFVTHESLIQEQLSQAI